MKILQTLTAIPTAPFVEDYVYEYVAQFVNARRSLQLSKDRFGNRLIELPGTDQNAERLVFVAHTDHPGFVAKKMISARTLLADFRGGVRRDHMKNARVRFFDGDREIRGTVLSTKASNLRSKDYASSAILRVTNSVPANTPGMFDEGIGRVKNGKFHCRVCDDLAGAAAAMEMLDQLCKKRVKSTVAVLLTRGEEEGFIGTIAAVLDGKLIRKSDRIISIETSAEQTYARQGDGVIIRAGDRTSVFNSVFTYFLTAQAEALARRNKSFKFQRTLMPGGSCEATVYDAYGYVTGAICVPLGNYHNMDRAKKSIGPEYVDLGDWNNMVTLFIRVASQIHTFDPRHTMLKERLKKRFEKLRKYL